MKKTVVIITAFGLFCTIFSDPLYARRIKAPLSLLGKLAQSLEKDLKTTFSAEEAAEDNFFEERWDDLDTGIRVNLEGDSFFEIRKIDGRIIIQYFNRLKNRVEGRSAEILENLQSVIEKKGINFFPPNVFIIDLTLRPIEAYTILNIPEKDFTIIAEDLSRQGKGSGKNAISVSRDILPMVEEMFEVARKAFDYEFINPEYLNNFYLTKYQTIQIFESAQKLAIERMQDIENGRIKMSLVNRIKEIGSLKVLSERLENSARILRTDNGYIIYRIFYRNYLVPFLQNRRDTKKPA